MSEAQFLQELRLWDFLSYKELKLPLKPLNVLIGANGSGKSNLLETFRVLQAAPGDIASPFRASGGVAEWIKKKGSSHARFARIEAIVSYPDGIMPLKYALQFASVAQRIEIVDEVVENEQPIHGKPDVFFFYRYQEGRPVLNQRLEEPGDRDNVYANRTVRKLRREDINVQQSVLSQRADQDIYPELTYLGQQFRSIRSYRGWDVGFYSPLRKPQATDAPNDFLVEDGSNLALVLNQLTTKKGYSRRDLLEDLQRLYDGITDFFFNIEGGTVQLFLREHDQYNISAARMSDGTLRLLCLLAILRHPQPPALICLEEPELGLHPDMMPFVAELLEDAARRTQLIVTTHSDALISGLSDPETVFVCERSDLGSEIRQLNADHLKTWLDDYTVGDLWRMGELGGTRW